MTRGRRDYSMKPPGFQKRGTEQLTRVKQKVEGEDESRTDVATLHHMISSHWLGVETDSPPLVAQPPPITAVKMWPHET